MVTGLGIWVAKMSVHFTDLLRSGKESLSGKTGVRECGRKISVI
jgi:hypothetical protein